MMFALKHNRNKMKIDKWSPEAEICPKAQTNYQPASLLDLISPGVKSLANTCHLANGNPN